MRRLLASGLLPQRAGQPVKALVHIAIADLFDMDRDSAMQDKWTTWYRARWAAHRAAASVSPGDGGAWLDGDDARMAACDAMIIPVVTADIDPGAIDDLIDLCVRYHHIRTASTASATSSTPVPASTPDSADSQHSASSPDSTGSPDLADVLGGSGIAPPSGTGGHSPASGATSAGATSAGATSAGATSAGPPGDPASHGEQAASDVAGASAGGVLAELEQQIIGTVLKVVAGPGGVASFLRRTLLGKGLNGPSSRWTSGAPTTSRSTCAAWSPYAISDVSTQEAATSPPQRASRTTSSTAPTAAGPA